MQSGKKTIHFTETDCSLERSKQTFTCERNPVEQHPPPISPPDELSGHVGDVTNEDEGIARVCGLEEASTYRSRPERHYLTTRHPVTLLLIVHIC